MPINYKEFKQGNFVKKASKDKRKHPIYLFLKKNKHSAFKLKEICKALKIKGDGARSMMRILKKSKLVEHKQPYFSLKR